MASDEFATIASADEPFQNPWPLLATGAALILVAVVWYHLAGEAATTLRVLLLVAGLLAVGGAVAIQPRSALVLGATFALGWLGCLALNPGSPPTKDGTPELAWIGTQTKPGDSARLILGVLSTCAGVAAILLLLPRAIRRGVVSVLILVHFGGILTAVASVPPQPWLSSFLWSYFYRPYLEFMYLNNAYHFYSPDPGPPTLLWAYLNYDDGTARWVKLPNREDFPLKLCYQRRLSLTESINQLSLPQMIPWVRAQEIQRARIMAGNVSGIAFHNELDVSMQYRPPVQFSRIMLKTYARHLARSTPHETDPGRQVTSVKLYRVVHRIFMPLDIQEKRDPLEPSSYLPYYQGEFDPDGNLKNPEDPFLYWLIPIVKVPKGSIAGMPMPPPAQRPAEEDLELRDYLKIHAEMRSAEPPKPNG